ncbi:Protein transport protein BOS1 [Meyerozyma sp. JA9]|nr:Protein transport protein BOS1 [Meyerozyma sp. JA9]
MNSLYNHGIKQTKLLSKELATFESNISTSPLSLQGSITTSLTAFRKTIKEYGDLVAQAPSDEHLTKHEARLEKFNKDLQEFTQKFDNLKLQRENLRHEANTQELMGRRHAGNTSENPYEAAENVQSPMMYHEGLAKEHSSLQRGSQQLDQILEMGQQAFEDIVGQNETLQRVKAKFEDSLVTLGVSRGTIRTIEKRARQDKWIFWAGVVLLFVCFWYILKWFR